MASNNIPYFRFYPADFMHGVRGMSAQEIGVYTMILCRIYESSGPVEYNPLRLSTYCGMRQATFDKVLEKLCDLGKLQMDGGMISNDRADIEISKRANDLESNSKAGKASAEKRLQNQRISATHVQQPFNHTDTDTDTDRIDLGKPKSLAFSEFWASWPNKTAKAAAEKAWRALSHPDRVMALENAVPWFNDWRKRYPDASPIHPATYLNKKRWTDEQQFDINSSAYGNNPRPRASRAGDGSATIAAFAAVAAGYRTEPQ
jgi:uncharacterized protein YdaU (DUF1376 family)